MKLKPTSVVETHVFLSPAVSFKHFSAKPITVPDILEECFNESGITSATASRYLAILTNHLLTNEEKYAYSYIVIDFARSLYDYHLSASDTILILEN
jgi:hypothetical protein